MKIKMVWCQVEKEDGSVSNEMVPIDLLIRDVLLSEIPIELVEDEDAEQTL
jgi:hypothetical protein